MLKYIIFVKYINCVCLLFFIFFFFVIFSRFQVLFLTKCVFCCVQPVALFGFYSSCFLAVSTSMSQSIFKGVRVLRFEVRRSIGIIATAWSKASDPIQQLFLDKVREYKQKSASGKMVNASPEIEREMKTDLERVAKQFDITDMTILM